MNLLGTNSVWESLSEDFIPNFLGIKIFNSLSEKKIKNSVKNEIIFFLVQAVIHFAKNTLRVISQTIAQKPIIQTPYQCFNLSAIDRQNFFAI